MLVDVASMAETCLKKTTSPISNCFPFPHFDTERLWRFMLLRLKSSKIDAVCATIHGAVAVLVQKHSELVLPVLDYLHDVPCNSLGTRWSADVSCQSNRGFEAICAFVGFEFPEDIADASPERLATLRLGFPRLLLEMKPSDYKVRRIISRLARMLRAASNACDPRTMIFGQAQTFPATQPR